MYTILLWYDFPEWNYSKKELFDTETTLILASNKSYSMIATVIFDKKGGSLLVAQLNP